MRVVLSDPTAETDDADARLPSLPPLTVALPDEGRRAIAEEWWYRAWAERDSARRYDRLLETMRAIDGPTHLIESCARAAEDERRHAVLCARLAARFDAHDPFADRPTPADPLGPGGLPTARRLLYEMVAFGCVTESLNASLLLETHDRATEPGVRAAAHALLSDEVQHARLGWAWLAWAEQRGAVGWLAQHAPAMLRAAASENLTSGDALCARWSAPAVGHLPRDLRVAIFVRCAVEVIAPGLARFGVEPDGMLDWLEQQSWV